MVKINSIKPWSMFSNWGLVLVVVSVILVVVVGFNCLLKDIPNGVEGFEQKEKVIIKEGPDVYDDFYASIYDELVYNKQKNVYEVGSIINSTNPTQQSKFLDIGSGTGHHVAELTNKGYDAMGVDISQFMVDRAKKLYPESNYVQGDVINSHLFAPDTFTHIFSLYFGIYYFKDKKRFFLNCINWLMPGGYLVVHLVDRNKFDPILPPANPIVGVSPQKYAKERLTKSSIVFNNMTYEANFEYNKDTNITMFSEKIKDKNTNKIRKNKHKMYMEPEKHIIGIAKECGFILQSKIDLLPVGYEYQYLYIFLKPN